jgi:Ala-tRNA(Pro) deacylase
LVTATPHDLFALLDRLGIAHQTVEHAPLFTVEQSRALRGSIVGGHSKNLFLKDKKGTLFLVVAPEEAIIDLKALPTLIDAARLSFGTAELMREVLGVEPGSVTPFAAMNDPGRRVTIVIDRALLAHQPLHEPLNFHPLVNTMTTAIGRDDLLRFLRATGHEPLLAAVSAGRAMA